MNGIERAHAIDAAIEDYERVARMNRPDWDAFLDEALRDTLSIVYEVEENSDLRFNDEDGSFDMLWTAVEEWLIDRRTAWPTAYFPPPFASQRAAHDWLTYVAVLPAPNADDVRVYNDPRGFIVGITPDLRFSLACDSLADALKVACA